MAEPVLWRLGLWEFRWPQLLNLLGLVGGLTAAGAALRPLPWPERRDLFLWTLPEALLAARVGYLALNLDVYLLAPARIGHLWDGGYSLGAGLLAGALALRHAAHQRGLDVWRITDGAVVGLAAAQLILCVGTALAAPSATDSAAALLSALRLVLVVALRFSAGARAPAGTAALLYLMLEALAVALRALLPSGQDAGFALAAWSGVGVAAAAILIWRWRRSSAESER